MNATLSPFTSKSTAEPPNDTFTLRASSDAAASERLSAPRISAWSKDALPTTFPACRILSTGGNLPSRQRDVIR